MSSLDALALPFRQRFLRHAELMAQLEAWQQAYPELIRLDELCQSPEGRSIPIVTVGRDPDRARPTAWVDAQVHATELTGSTVALAFIEALLRLHLEPEGTHSGLPERVQNQLRRGRFFIVPRVSVDGAEAVLTTGRYVRSNLEDRRPGHRPRWVNRDVDGDGLSLLMRKEDPTGEFVESHAVPGLMLPRELESVGPFYKLYPEGFIEDGDGQSIPNPYFLSDADTDLNRNFPWDWKPEPHQEGAGSFPMSEPESRAIVEFASTHPEIFAWLDLHTFGGCFIRPLGHAPDKKLPNFDLAVWKQLGAWAETHTGYPMVSGFEEFTYQPDKPLNGALSEFAWYQRGALGFVCELWDLFAQLGIERKRPFVDHYTQLTRDELERLGRWDAEHNQGRLLRPWKRVHHPQLGAVDVGGLDPRIGLSNPPLEQLESLCAKQTAFFLRLAALAPEVVVEVEDISELAPGVRRLRIAVENRGYLPTFIAESAKELPWNQGLVLEAAGEGLTVEGPRVREVGHLEGWGRGLQGETTAIFFQRSRGSVSRKVVELVVTGSGALLLSARSPRTGEVVITTQL